jgi:hypothetical protein
LTRDAAIAVISKGAAILTSLNGIRPFLQRKGDHPSPSLSHPYSRSGGSSASQVQSNGDTVRRHRN